MNNNYNNKTLGLALKEIQIDEQSDIPPIVRLLENPSSPLALPGSISLFDHDCLHILLDRLTSLDDEAYVIGFTMGCDRRSQAIHVKIFKFFAQYLYPKKYQFSPDNLKHFDLGFQDGRRWGIQLNSINFSLYQDWSVADLRQKLMGNR